MKDKERNPIKGKRIKATQKRRCERERKKGEPIKEKEDKREGVEEKERNHEKGKRREKELKKLLEKVKVKKWKGGSNN